MEFTFTDYTFSGLLSILAALYGVGYPLIIQSIEKISAQYSSSHISERFTREGRYLLFQGLLILNMAFAITTPFLLHAGWNNVLFLTLQAVLLVLLVGQTFLLFNLILKYSNGAKLLKHIEGRQIDKHNIYQIFDLAVYADANHLYPLYLDCMSDIFAYIYAQQGDKNGQDMDTVLPPAMYDDVTFDLARKIKGFIREDDGHHYLYRQNDIVSAFYNQVSQSRQSVHSRQIMWAMVNDAIAYDNKSWFSQYWQFADSYANLKYHFIRYDQKELRLDKEVFVDQHVMTGTALVHWKRYDWLNDIFFYTHSEPEYYGLIPSSFSEIIHYMRRLALQCDNPLAGGWKYYFNDSMVGVTDEKLIFREAVRYLSLLVIRLWSVKGRNLMDWNDVMQTPAFPLLITDQQQEINLLEMMMKDVENWINIDVFKLIPNLTQVDVKTVSDYIGGYRFSCEKNLQDKQEHPTVGKKEYDELHEQFIEEIGKIRELLPNEGEYENGTSISTEIRYKDKLDTINYSGYIRIDCRCIPNVICTNFWNEVALMYMRCLDGKKRLGDFKVPRKQIKNVLRAIGTDSKYAIISTEKIEELDDNTINLRALLNVKWFFVVKSDEIPRVALKSVDDLPEIMKNSGVCSNLEEFQGCNDPVYFLELATKFKLSYPGNFSGYVRFTIDDTFEVQNVTIKPKQTLDDLFGLKAED